MARRLTQELAFSALAIEGGLLAPDFLNKVAHLEASEQSEADYDVPRGLKLRDEIGRYWKIAQNLWQDFDAKRRRSDLDTHAITVRDFLEPLCRQVLGFADLRPIGQVVLDERIFPIGFCAGEGRVPVIFAAYDQGLDKPSSRHGDGIRRRSPFLLTQEYLNASEKALWAVVSNGLRLRVLRDNPSFTRPAYIEADLEAIFTEGLYPDFTALWLLTHGTRFGKVGAEPADCPIERWRNTVQEDGIRARERLRVGVTEALRALGTGFIVHSANGLLRERIQNGELSPQAFFEQLLRLIYRLIFLATIEDRELVFAPDANPEAKARYHAGYSLQRLRQLAARRRSYDRYCDLWQVLAITVAGFENGEPALGLPALGGLFEANQCPDLDGAALENQALLSALFSLCFFRQGAALSRVNYRDMDSEELGSVYESLLELVPMVTLAGGARTFGFVDDGEEGSTKGNARKLTGSYYTPDSLVQELIKSALEPVIEQTLKANPQEPVKALLGLTVCDPACGSGHFLLAAARRIAEEVARLNAPDGNPLPEDYRRALRDTVARCIYGVDKNPMAVELARTALWLEAYTPDRPLTFLDHHLRCGDALLGVLDPAILDRGIPDKAFNALSGDHKDAVKAIKKANRDALKAIEKTREKSHQMLSLGLEQLGDIAALEALPDDTLAALEAKRAAYRDAEAHIATSCARLAADLFVAAFVLPKTTESERCVPTSQDLWLVMNGSAPRPDVAAVAAQAARTAQAFHWWQVFPQVKARGGFDVLLGNPPWERIKLQEEEFFATRSPSVAAAPHKAERGRRIGLLAEGMLLHTLYPEAEAAQGLVPPNRAEQQLYADFLAARRGAEAASLFAHDAGRYPLTGVGDVNTYALFAETFAQLVSETGRAGFIVPTGIATDDSTKAYFEAISQNGRLSTLLAFENEEFIFSEVHHAFRFCVLTLGVAERAEFVFFARQPSQVHDSRRRFTLTPEEFRLINPNTRTCPVFRSQMDAELTKKLYLAAPVLIAENPPEQNPWGIRFATMFHMSNDSDLFHDAPAADRLPLYEAKMIHQFDHRWATYRANGECEDVSEVEKFDPEFSVFPHYWVNTSEVEQRLADKRWDRGWLIGWRNITGVEKIRGLIASVMPRCAVGNSLTLLFPAPMPAAVYACLYGNLGALVFDFVLRQKLGGANFNQFIARQLPVIPPDRYADADVAFIAPRVLELTYTSHEVKPWAQDLQYDGEPFAWDPERRALLRAELDAYYARLYGLTREELQYILDPADVMGDDYPSETFRVLKNDEIREFGEYRTRRLVLKAWDSLESGELKSDSSPVRSVPVVYSDLAVIRSEAEAEFASLIAALIKQYQDGISVAALQAFVSRATAPGYPELLLEPKEAERLQSLVNGMSALTAPESLTHIPPLVYRLEVSGAIRSERRGGTTVFIRGASSLPADVRSLPEHLELAKLMLKLEARRELARKNDVRLNEPAERGTDAGTRTG
ncbi:Eco57I restriction-modification methylase domain-containing protein [Paraburkholderia ginsengiterrae]|uniref:Eco57I restriction-modification methylase domain-containing protein n=1 Tax=Paraburkholderia ginsengiterrae TaxID=1462993 RepID=UPI0009EE9B62|nr:N-6 DNA methylase [Paraburkholderia ginsengiterrae]